MSTEMMLIQAVRGHAVSRPNAIAIEFDDRMVSWHELWRNVQNQAGLLASNGVSQGDRVGILSASCPEYIASILACALSGAVCAPFSLMLNDATLGALIEDSAPTLVLVNGKERNSFADHSEFNSTAPIVAFATDEKKHWEGATSASPGSAMSLVYSSGTTGVPKGIVHSRNARDAYATVFALEYGIQQNSRTLLATPLYSNGTWMTLLPTILAGGCCVIRSELKTTDLRRVIDQEQITHAFLVPTQLNEIFASGSARLSDRSVTIISAGSFLPLGTKRAILDSENVELFELYGNTEGVCSILRPHQMEQGFDSVGTAIATGEISIETSGEICGRNALQSSGYHNRPQLTDELFVDDGGTRKFVRSGDIGAIGDDGFLRLKGRLKDMIVSGGVNVYPIDIETSLESIEGIREASVIGVPHDKWGETPVAFVILDCPSSHTHESLLRLANQRLNKHQRLSRIELVQQFPRNALGKVIKTQLLPHLSELPK